jgi:hypothetical protein
MSLNVINFATLAFDYELVLDGGSWSLQNF